MRQPELQFSGGDASEMLNHAAPVFAALGHETRLRLAMQLGDGEPRSISDLTVHTDITRQALTKHLNVLANAGLIHGTRRGREHLWELDRDGVLAAQLYFEEISLEWDDALDRLKAFVERDE